MCNQESCRISLCLCLHLCRQSLYLQRARIQNRPGAASEGRTNWKQLRTEGSMLEPPKDATSPSCRGIWMESWRRRPKRRWSQKPVALATCRNKTGDTEENEEGEQKKSRSFSSQFNNYNMQKLTGIIMNRSLYKINLNSFKKYIFISSN